MHRFANPARFLRIARPLTAWLLGLGLLSTAVGLYGALFVMPADFLQGETARILHVHVPAAWLGMGGWTVIAGASLASLFFQTNLCSAQSGALPPRHREQHTGIAHYRNEPACPARYQ